MLGYQFPEAPEADESIINILLDDVFRHIKNFCNLPELTEEIQEALTGYITDRVAGQFVFMKRSTGAMEGMLSFTDTPKSVSEGDTTISFGGGAVSPEEGYTKELEDMRNRSDDELLRFRRLQWQA